MRRRTFLRTAAIVGSTGSLGSLAGCTGGGGSASTPATATSPAAGSGGGSPTVSVVTTDEYGDVLVGPDGLSLYLFEEDTDGAMTSACSGSCADAWPPLTVTETPTKGDGVVASLSTFEREDGATQVVAGGWPLYHFQGDDGPGDTNGQEVEGFGGEWYLLAPDGTKREGEEGGGGGY